MRARVPSTHRHLQETPIKEVDRCVPQELSLDCCLENERVIEVESVWLCEIESVCIGGVLLTATKKRERESRFQD